MKRAALAVVGLALAGYIAPRAALADITLQDGTQSDDTFSWSGTTIGAPTWTRSTIDDDPGTFLAKVGGGEGYFAEELTVGTTGNYTFTVQQNGTGTGDWDGVAGNILGFLYQNPFDPSNSLSNQLWNGGPGAYSSWQYNLVAGEDYWIVVTGYCGTGSGPGYGQVPGCTGPATLEEGPFTASLTGPGTVRPVPEPGTLLLLGASLAGFVGLQRRKLFR